MHAHELIFKSCGVSVLKWKGSNAVPDDEVGLRGWGGDDMAVRGGGQEGTGRSSGTEVSDKSDILALTAEELITDIDAEAAQSLDPTIHNAITITTEDDGTTSNGQTSEGGCPTEIEQSNNKEGKAIEGLDTQSTVSADGGKESAGQNYEYVYEGEWHRGLRHGEGRLIYPTGEEYVGHWVKNVRHGVGVLQATEFTYEVS